MNEPESGCGRSRIPAFLFDEFVMMIEQPGAFLVLPGLQPA
jgi:hypothetical protein